MRLKARVENQRHRDERRKHDDYYEALSKEFARHPPPNYNVVVIFVVVAMRHDFL